MPKRWAKAMAHAALEGGDSRHQRRPTAAAQQRGAHMMEPPPAWPAARPLNTPHIHTSSHPGRNTHAHLCQYSDVLKRGVCSCGAKYRVW
jgi:hypothetical protein